VGRDSSSIRTLIPGASTDENLVSSIPLVKGDLLLETTICSTSGSSSTIWTVSPLELFSHHAGTFEDILMSSPLFPFDRGRELESEFPFDRGRFSSCSVQSSTLGSSFSSSVSAAVFWFAAAGSVDHLPFLRVNRLRRYGAPMGVSPIFFGIDYFVQLVFVFHMLLLWTYDFFLESTSSFLGPCCLLIEFLFYVALALVLTFRLFRDGEFPFDMQSPDVFSSIFGSSGDLRVARWRRRLDPLYSPVAWYDRWENSFTTFGDDKRWLLLLRECWSLVQPKSREYFTASEFRTGALRLKYDWLLNRLSAVNQSVKEAPCDAARSTEIVKDLLDSATLSESIEGESHWRS